MQKCWFFSLSSRLVNQCILDAWDLTQPFALCQLNLLLGTSSMHGCILVYSGTHAFLADQPAAAMTRRLLSGGDGMDCKDIHATPWLPHASLMPYSCFPHALWCFPHALWCFPHATMVWTTTHRWYELTHKQNLHRWYELTHTKKICIDGMSYHWYELSHKKKTCIDGMS